MPPRATSQPHGVGCAPFSMESGSYMNENKHPNYNFAPPPWCGPPHWIMPFAQMPPSFPPPFGFSMQHAPFGMPSMPQQPVPLMSIGTQPPGAKRTAVPVDQQKKKSHKKKK
eukprot:575396-Rhodomonas_salina.1